MPQQLYYVIIFVTFLGVLKYGYKAIMKLGNERSLILISNRDLPLWNEMKADRHVIETLSARLSHNSQMIYL